MLILNLGCGTKTCSSEEVINIDWSMYLRLRKNPFLRTIAPFFLRGERRRRFLALPSNIMVHDLSKGIPFDSDSVDVVYHSHMLEHLDRDVARTFLLEVKRVLKAGGIQRIAIPDLEVLCREYLEHVAVSDQTPGESADHEVFVEKMFLQFVQRESPSTSRQPLLRRFLENMILGGPRRRGEAHRWMYDRISLSEILLDLGYRDVQVQQYDTSFVGNWNEYRLDVDESGKQCNPDSLYLECRKAD